MVEWAHIYMAGNGRISMAGLNSHSVEYVAESLDKVVRGRQSVMTSDV
jgi:aspartate aminotransferase